MTTKSSLPENTPTNAPLAGHKKIRVLIVDDSALTRQLLSRILESDAAIEVVATAPDPYIAREKIKRFNPDVLTLDVEMPRMDGVTFLRNLMRLRPMPVVMISAHTERGAEATLDALELGAVDFVTKPKIDSQHTLDEFATEITGKVKGAASARVQPLRRQAAARETSAPKGTQDEIRGTHLCHRFSNSTEFIVAIGSSTGGTEALKKILEQLPPRAPSVLIAQHIPPGFSRSFAERLDRVSPLNVCEASNRQEILPGHAYIAPGDRHLTVVRDGTRFLCALSSGPKVNRHRPSADVLFRSVAQIGGKNALAIILTGMGSDGSEGLAELRAAGAATLAQDRQSSVVWGMPGAAVQRGSVERVLSLDGIAEVIRSIGRG